MKAWSKHKFSNNNIRIIALKKELQSITNSHRNYQDTNRIKRIKEELESLWRREEMFWGLKSRINWLRWGDKNTKYFHAETIQRRQKNRIQMLKNEEDQWVRGKQQLQHLTTSFFKALYTSEGTRNYDPVLNQCPALIEDDINDCLVAEVTMEEVRAATFQLGAQKAPGPDGLNGLFYQHHWDIISLDILKGSPRFFSLRGFRSST